jgi:inner membrane protein
MDPVTQSLVAFTAGRAGLRTLSAGGEVILIAAALLPDVDLLTGFLGSTELIAQHRGITHSIAALPAGAILVATVARLIGGKKVRFLGAFLLACFGLMIHAALDWVDMLGGRFLYPFEERLIHAGFMPWFDPWLFLILLLAVLWPFLSKLVDIELGIREAAGQWFAIFVLLLVGLYGGYRWGNLESARLASEELLIERTMPLRIELYPDTWSLVRVHVVAESENKFANVDYRRGDPIISEDAQLLPKLDDPLLIDAARKSESYQKIATRLQFPSWKSYPADQPEGAREVIMRDLLLSPERNSWFVLRLVIDRNYRVLEEDIIWEF